MIFEGRDLLATNSAIERSALAFDDLRARAAGSMSTWRAAVAVTDQAFGQDSENATYRTNVKAPVDIAGESLVDLLDGWAVNLHRTAVTYHASDQDSVFP